MEIELKITAPEDSLIIKNLWPLYQHDVSEFDDSIVANRHGLIGVDDSVATAVEHGDQQDLWWSDPASLFPYLILVNGLPAGFNLVAARSRLPKGIDADFVVHEFFLLHAYRGKGVAEQAAIEGFEMHRGMWEIVTWPANTRAIAFWRRVIGRYSSASHSGTEVDHPWGRRVAFRFSNMVGENVR